MKFELKYIFRKMKKNIALAVASVFSIAAIISIIVIASNCLDFFKMGSENYQRQLFGNGDIVISIGQESSDRFFGINATGLPEDEILSNKAEYINGFFKSYAEIETSEKTMVTSIIACDWKELNSYNPVKLINEKIDNIAQNEVVIGDNLAKTMKLSRGDDFLVKFGANTARYNIIAIAKNTGIFANTLSCNNLVLFSPSGFSKLFPLYSSGIVSHCIIKAKNSQEINLIMERATILAEPLSLEVSPVIDPLATKELLRLIEIPINFISICTLLFSGVALLIIFRNYFAKDQENFELLHDIGISSNRIKIIQLLQGLAFAVLSSFLACLILFLFMFLITNFFPILQGALIKPISYIVGFGCGLVICVLASLLAKRKEMKKISLPTSKLFSKKNVIILILFAVSFIFAFTSRIGYGYLRLLIQIVALGLLIFLSPVVLEMIISFFKYRKLKLLYTQSIFKKNNWKKISIFFLINCAVVGVMLTFSSSSKQYAWRVSNNTPYDILVTTIARPDQKFVEEIEGIDGVSLVEKGAVFLSQSIKGKDFSSSTCLIALEKTGFSLFADDVEENERAFTDLINNPSGVVVSYEIAQKYSLVIGEQITTTINYVEYQFELVGFLNSQYFMGNCFFINLERITSSERPYAHLLISSNGKPEETIQRIYLAFRANNITIINIKQYQMLWYESTMIFINLLVAIYIVISLIIFSAFFVLLMLWHDMEKNYYRKMNYLGMSNKNNLRVSTFSATYTFFSMAIMNILVIDLIVKIFNIIIAISKKSPPIEINFPMIIVFSLIYALMILLLHIISYLIVVRKKQKNIMN